MTPVALFDRLPEVFYTREIVATSYANAGRIDQACRHALNYVEELRGGELARLPAERFRLLPHFVGIGFGIADLWAMIRSCPSGSRLNTHSLSTTVSSPLASVR